MTNNHRLKYFKSVGSFLPINLYMSSSKILISANKKESFFLGIEQLFLLEHSSLLPECSGISLGVELFR